MECGAEDHHKTDNKMGKYCNFYFVIKSLRLVQENFLVLLWDDFAKLWQVTQQAVI